MKRSETMENDYHNPYDHRPLGLVKSTNNSDSDQTANLYEAPSCLVRNPSGSLFIPSSTGKYLLYIGYPKYGYPGVTLKPQHTVWVWVFFTGLWSLVLPGHFLFYRLLVCVLEWRFGCPKLGLVLLSWGFIFYEALSCLVRNPSGYLLIPSSTGKLYVPSSLIFKGQQPQKQQALRRRP